MRHFYILLFCVSTLVSAKAETSFNLDNFTYTLISDDEVSVVAADYSLSGEIIIPETVQHDGKSYTVTSIGVNAFNYRREITGISLPGTIESIGAFAFYNCNSLTSIEIPNSVASIGEWAFASCSNLRAVLLPNQLKNIERNTFSDCSSLASIEIPTSVANIGESAFSGCRNITSIEIPESVNFIGDSAFSGSGIVSVTIPNSVKQLGKGAFSSCYELSSVSLSSGIEKIEDNLFSGCSRLEEIIIPSSVLAIGKQAFFAAGLKDITLPSSVATIDDLAFFLCAQLQHIDIPASVNTIGVSVFGESGISEITVNPDNKCFTSLQGALYNKDLTEIIYCPPSVSAGGEFVIPGTITKIGQSAFWGNSFESIVIPESVLEIDTWGFAGCKKLKSITIPASVTAIGVSPFTQCEALESIVVDPSNENYSSKAGLLYNKDKTALIQCPGAAKQCVIDDRVKTICEGAFESCRYLNNVKLPNSVSEIGARAFEYCSQLTFIVVPDKVSVLSDKVFDECRALSSVILPNSITAIGESAFGFCQSLTQLTLGDKIEKIASSSFAGSGINKLEISASTPPVIEGEHWNLLTASDGVITVPSQYLIAYRTNDDWQKITLSGAPFLANEEEAVILDYEANKLCGIQYDIEIPDGVELIIPAETGDALTVQSTELTDKKLRYIVYTKNGQPMESRFTCIAKASNADRSMLKISNIILSIEDLPISRADVNVPVTGYALDGFTLPDVDEGMTVVIEKPLQLDFEDVEVEWYPYSSELAELTSDGDFTAHKAGRIDDLGFCISDPLVGDIIEALASIVIRTAFGDVDGSGLVDIADVVATVNYILMRNPDPFIFKNADIDGSGDINIADLTRIIKIVLSQSNSTTRRAKMLAQATNDEVAFDGCPASMAADGMPHAYLSLNTNHAYTALQLDVQLSDGVHIASVSIGDEMVNHVLDYASINDHTTRIIIYSNTLAELPSGDRIIDIALESGQISADASISATGILCVESDGNKYIHTDSEANLSEVLSGLTESLMESVSVSVSNGVVNVCAPASASVRVVDLNGRIVCSMLGSGSVTLDAGIYIVLCNGIAPRKIFVN